MPIFWQNPPKIKIYEALGCLGDSRLELVEEKNELFETEIIKAKCYSSSRNKFYEVSFDPEKKQIMTNDNGSWFVGYLGYPAIALLMQQEALEYNQKWERALNKIAWKDINQEFKNDFTKTEQYCLNLLQKRGFETEEFLSEVENIYGQIIELKLVHLGPKIKPPSGY